MDAKHTMSIKKPSEILTLINEYKKNNESNSYHINTYQKELERILYSYATYYCQDVEKISIDELKNIELILNNIIVDNRGISLPATTMKDMAKTLGYRILQESTMCPIAKCMAYKITIWKNEEKVASQTILDTEFENKIIREERKIAPLKIKIKSIEDTISCINNQIPKILNNDANVDASDYKKKYTDLIEYRGRLQTDLEKAYESFYTNSNLPWVSFQMAMKIKRICTIVLRDVVSEFRMVSDESEKMEIDEINKKKDDKFTTK